MSHNQKHAIQNCLQVAEIAFLPSKQKKALQLKMLVYLDTNLTSKRESCNTTVRNFSGKDRIKVGNFTVN